MKTLSQLFLTKATQWGALALATGVLVSTVQAVPLNQFVPNKSKITFVSKQMGVPVEGKFSQFKVAISLDSDKPEAAKGFVTIELASIDTGSKDGDDEVMGKNWFDIKKYPQARFDLKSTKNLGAGKIQLNGDLTIKGKTKPLSSIATLKVNGQSAEMSGDLVFKRMDYAIGEGTWGDVDVVANEVQVHYQILMK